MQWEQRAGHNGGEGGPPLRSRPHDPPPPRLPRRSRLAVSRFWPFSGAPPVRVRPAVVQNRRSGTARLGGGSGCYDAPGVRAGSVCVASRRALRCRRRCNLPDGYMHCYYAARLPDFSASAPSRSTSPDGRRQRRRQVRRSDCARHSSPSIDDDDDDEREEEEAIASPEAGKLLAVIGKLRNADVAVIIRRTDV